MKMAIHKGASSQSQVDIKGVKAPETTRETSCARLRSFSFSMAGALGLSRMQPPSCAPQAKSLEP
jgi:hypothetical protein